MKTWTSLVTEKLRDTDDFMNYAQLMAATGGTCTQISAACHHLRKCRVVDVIVEKDGVGWWYALPPEEDQRQHVTNHIAPSKRNRKNGYHVRRTGPVKKRGTL